MIAVIFWALLGAGTLGMTLYLLAMSQAATVTANDGVTMELRLADGSRRTLPVAMANGDCPFLPVGRQVTFLPESLTRRQAAYTLMPKRMLLRSGVGISLLFLALSVMVYMERFT